MIALLLDSSSTFTLKLNVEVYKKNIKVEESVIHAVNEHWEKIESHAVPDHGVARAVSPRIDALQFNAFSITEANLNNVNRKCGLAGPRSTNCFT